MTSIQGYVRALADGALGELTSEQQEGLQIIDRNVVQLTSLIDSFEDAQGMKSKKTVLALQDLPLLPLVTECIQSFEPMAQEKKLTLHLQCPAPLEQATVRADAIRLKQVLFNLLGNAIKYTLQGQVTARIAKKGRSIEISVEDTGLGVSKTEQSRVFQKFYRTQGAKNNQAAQGKGLGLWIAKAIVEAHKGKILFKSTAGKGTRVSVSLPITSNSRPSR